MRRSSRSRTGKLPNNFNPVLHGQEKGCKRYYGVGSLIQFYAIKGIIRLYTPQACGGENGMSPRLISHVLDLQTQDHAIKPYRNITTSSKALRVRYIYSRAGLERSIRISRVGVALFPVAVSLTFV